MSEKANGFEPYRGEFRYVFFSPTDRYESTVKLYRDVLKLPVITELGGPDSERRRTDFQASLGVIEVVTNSGQSELKSILLKPGEEYSAPVGGYFEFEVEDVDAAHRRAVDMGADVIQNISDWPWRYRDFKVKDPCGNVVCPFSRLREEEERR